MVKVVNRICSIFCLEMVVSLTCFNIPQVVIAKLDADGHRDVAGK